MLMKKLLIALAGIMMMGMMTNCNESKPVADSQQQEVKVGTKGERGSWVQSQRVVKRTYLE